MVRGRKISGGKYKKLSKRKLHSIRGQTRKVKLSEKKQKVIRGRGGNKKTVLLSENFINLIDLKTRKSKKVSIKNVLETFFSEFYKREVPIRFRPGYFPFVEPGVEVDMLYKSSRGEKWLELMGAGMVHPNVLKSAGIDPDKFQGFAFGVGIERLIAIRHDIEDVRLFHDGDLRFVNQF